MTSELTESTHADPTPERPVRNILLRLSYDGTNYLGWQVQPDGITVQECVEAAVLKVTGESRRVLCAGRTDTGVHALGQAASFLTTSRIPIERVRRAIQTHLPEDIVVVSAREVSLELHATFSTVRKRYRYVLFDGDACPPFLIRYVQRSQVRLNAALMHEAAQHLLGTHDFRCFEKQYPNKFSSVRTIMDTSVTRTAAWHPWLSGAESAQLLERPHEAPQSPFIVFEVMADGFLYNMVRAIVGTLVDVGRGKCPPSHMAEVVASLDRSHAGMTAVPQGLYLVQADYPEQLLQPARQLQ